MYSVMSLLSVSDINSKSQDAQVAGIFLTMHFDIKAFTSHGASTTRETILLTVVISFLIQNERKLAGDLLADNRFAIYLKDYTDILTESGDEYPESAVEG